ncbi:MAG: helix-turn-helix domain-containing protein [Oscillospiraceae bacterium]|nr:helix-turn-helix domain-containing protein [Oscillospiraceae bacterium]
MELNERLAQLRKEHGLSQNDLAEKLNVSRQAISRWEQGLAMPSSDNLIYLSRLYGITLDELIYGKEEIENEQAEEAEEISVPEETDSAKTQTRPWSKKWWVKILFGILILGLVVFFAVGEIENGNVIPLWELTAESLDLTSAEYFSWDNDR